MSKQSLSSRERLENYKQEFLSREKNLENDQDLSDKNVSGNRSTTGPGEHPCGNT